MKNHKPYLVEDFVLDDSFRNWVLSEDPEEDAYWKTWKNRHPEYWHVMEEAREMVRGLQHQPAEVSQEEIEEGFLEIADHFDQTVQDKALWSKSFLIKIAAAVLLLVAAGLGVLYQNQSNQQLTEYITQYGENKKVGLPDGSRVYMKGNTRLSYFPDWEKRRERKVNLQGEAYFQVKEKFYQGRKTKFIVSTQNLDVEVVGTEFVVRNLTHKTRIRLNSGKVKLNLRGRSSMDLSPGDVVDYFTSNREIVKQRKDIGPKSSWLKDFEGSTESTRETAGNKSGEQTENTGSGQLKKEQPARSVRKSIQKQDPANTSWLLNRENNNSANPPSQTGPGIPSPVASYTGQGASSGSDQTLYILQLEETGEEERSHTGVIIQEGEDNQAYIRQIGKNLRSSVEQTGHQNKADAIFSGENYKDEADDLEWSTRQIQDGMNNISFFRIMESYNTNLYSSQKGYENLVDIESEGFANKGIIYQEGEYNEAWILQYGSFNQAGLDPLTPGVLQEGQYNEIDIMQMGAGHSTQTIQRGNNNQIEVNQKEK